MQSSLEYRGQLLDDRLTATVGLRAPYFTRELNQYCFTPNGGTGNSSTSFNSTTLCTSRTPTATLDNGNVIFQSPLNPTANQYIAPYSDTVKFDELLPNLGLSFSPTDNQQLFLSFAEGLSAPRTDNLYSVNRQPDGSLGRGLPESETTQAYDLGWRLNASRTIASVALYYIDYTNRIVTSYDQALGFSLDRNVGDVKVQGVDLQIGQRIGDALSLTASAAYNDSELQDDIPTSNPDAPIPTAGKTLVETPKWMFTGRAEIDVTENLRFGLQGKRVDERYATDLNDEIAPAYTVFDLDVTWGFQFRGVKGGELRLNVTNLLDEDYLGNISSSTGGGSTAFYSLGAPRTVMGSVKFDF